METTRHFVATVYVVHDGSTALHRHDTLGMWLPPGGHLARDELPHEAALREVREELGLEVDLVAPQGDLSSPTARSVPEPHHVLLEDIDVVDGRVAHQHLDFVFYAEADSATLDPDDGEAPPDAWEWFTPADLRDRADELEPDVVDAGLQAIRTVSSG